MQLRSVRSWTSVDQDDVQSYRTAAKCLPEFKHPQRASGDSPRTGPTSTITTYQNIHALQQILMRHRQISLRTNCLFQQQQFMKSSVIISYASETWTLKETDKKKLLTFEVKCYRRILRISWKDMMRNEDI